MTYAALAQQIELAADVDGFILAVGSTSIALTRNEVLNLIKGCSHHALSRVQYSQHGTIGFLHEVPA